MGQGDLRFSASSVLMVVLQHLVAFGDRSFNLEQVVMIVMRRGCNATHFVSPELLVMLLTARAKVICVVCE